MVVAKVVVDEDVGDDTYFSEVSLAVTVASDVKPSFQNVDVVGCPGDEVVEEKYVEVSCPGDFNVVDIFGVDVYVSVF